MAAFCSACGTSLSENARFCRACGSAQEPAARAQAPVGGAQAPVAAAPLPVTAPVSSLDLVTAALAIVGGAAMCFLVLYATVYLPLDNDSSVNYGQGLRLGDVVALLSGLAAMGIGTALLSRRPRNPTATGGWLVVAGTPTLVGALIWAFPEALDLSLYPVPLYFAYVYFTDLGIVEVNQGFVCLPLVIACASVVAAGFGIVSQPATQASPVVPR